MDISAHDLRVIGVLPINDDRLVTSLKQMAKDLMPPVVALRVGSLQPFHPRHEVCLGSLHQQMIVIAHQHVSVNEPAGFLAGFLQGFEKTLPIRIVFEDRAALIAAGHDMIYGTGILDAQRASHARKPDALNQARQPEYVTILGLTLLLIRSQKTK